MTARKGSIPRRADGTEIHIEKRSGELATDREVRSAILRAILCLNTTYTIQERVAAVDTLLRTSWLSRCHGQRLGATARDGFDAALTILVNTRNSTCPRP